MIYRVVNTDLNHNGKYYPEGSVIEGNMIDAAAAEKLSHVLRAENSLQNAADVLNKPSAPEIELPVPPVKTGKKKNT